MLRCSATIGRLQKCWSRSAHRRVTSVSKLRADPTANAPFVCSFVRSPLPGSKLTRKRGGSRLSTLNISRDLFNCTMGKCCSVFIIFYRSFIVIFRIMYDYTLLSLRFFFFFFLMEEGRNLSFLDKRTFYFILQFDRILFSLRRDKW